MVANMQPYYNVPWQVMNNPRHKQITIGAWEHEENITSVKAVVSPLQNGDSGGRDYYDGLLPRSKAAQS